MASHVACLSSDIEPHSFPPPRPTARDHGVMSQYEQMHVMHDTLPFYRPISKQRREEDDINPVRYILAPTLVQASHVAAAPDPDLGVTPEKVLPIIKHVSRGESQGAGPKARQRVRFDLDEMRASEDRNRDASPGETNAISYSYDIGNDDEEDDCDGDFGINSNGDVDETRTKTYAYNTGSNNDKSCINASTRNRNSPERSEMPTNTYAYNVGLNEDKYCINTSSQNRNSFERSELPTNTDMPILTEGRTIYARGNIGSDSPAMPKAGGPGKSTDRNGHVLGEVELHSTLRVEKELEQLQRTELDLATAVSKHLKISSSTRSKISEKVCEKLNQQQRVYGQLVSVEVPEKDLLEKHRAAKLKTLKSIAPGKPPKPSASKPDIMEFFSADFQKEFPTLTLEGLAPPEVKPFLAPSEAAFDIYTHIRCWENIK